MVGYFDMVKYGTTNGYNCYGNLASTMVGYKYKYIYINTGWGPQDCVQVPYFSGWTTMVYGRYNELVNGDFHGYNWGPHPVEIYIYLTIVIGGSSQLIMIVPFYQKKQPQLQAQAIHENPPSALWSAEPSFMGSIVPFCKILCNEQS